MKYAVYFSNKEIQTKIVSSDEAKQILEGKAKGDIIEIQGGFFEHWSITGVDPIKPDRLEIDPSRILQEKNEQPPVSRERLREINEEIRAKGYNVRKMEEI